MKKKLLPKFQPGGSVQHINGANWDFPKEQPSLEPIYNRLVKEYESNPDRFAYKVKPAQVNFEGKKLIMNEITTPTISEAITRESWNKFLKYLKNTKFVNPLSIVNTAGLMTGVVNDKKNWDKMTPQQQKALDQSAMTGQKISPTMWKAMGIN